MELIIILLAIAAVCFMSMYDVKVQKVPFNEAPKAAQDAWLRRHPAKAWKMNLAKAFMSYADDYNAKVTWWKEHSNDVKHPKDMETIIRVANIVKSTIDSSNAQLGQMSTIGIWINLKVFNVKSDELVRRKFGKKIKDLYKCSYLLDEGKKLVECPQVPTDEEILLSWRNGRNLKYKPIFTNELLALSDDYAQKIVFNK